MIEYAVVSYNDQNDPDIPIKGAFKVYCPRVYGHDVPIGVTSVNGPSAYQYMYESPWVLPRLESYDDFTVPEVGDSVYIDFVEGTGDNPIFYGIAPDDEDFFNQLTQTMQAAYSKAVEDPAVDRVVGVRNGTYIKFRNDDSGLITIESLGKNIDNPTRLGSKIEINGNDKTVKLYAQTDDGSKVYEINCDAANELISILTQNGKEFTLDDINNISQLIDDIGNSIVLDDDGITVTDKNGNSITMDSEGISATDKNGQFLTMDSSGVYLNGSTNKLKFYNSVHNMRSLIEELLNTLISMKTSGSPALHTVSPDDIAKFNALLVKFQNLLEA